MMNTFQVAGSFGFLVGPIAGGVTVALTGAGGRPAYEAIFAAVGALEVALAGATVMVLRKSRAQIADGAPR